MPKPSAEERLGRLLAIVPWVAAHDGPPVAEVCHRFGVGEEELLDDLNLLFLCGVYPFTPDVLIDVDVADGRVWIRMADYFRRPLRLSPQEALALVSAGSALLSVPGADADGALATALAKLDNVLGVGSDDGLDIELAQVTPPVLHAVRQATDSRRKVDLDYYSFGRDGHSRRVVQPWRVFNATGQWYLSGWCESAGGERLFRVDRISRAEVLAASFDPPASRGPETTEVYHPSPDDARVVLDLDPPVQWIAEQYPNDGVEVRSHGVLRVTLR
ncbi:MAG TPA: WYL domain-containing protein, partial [Acidimicrobiales bacterium]